MHQTAFSRDATEKELRQARAFLEKQAEKYERPVQNIMDEQQVWADYGHVLFNLKEFIHLL